MNHNDPFLRIDRDHELAGERADDFDAALARETVCQIAAMRMAAAAGDADTLDALADSVAHLLGQPGVMQGVIRSAISSPSATGSLAFLGVLNKCIEDDAELAALKVLEQIEHLAVNRVRRDVAAAYGVRVADWSAA